MIYSPLERMQMSITTVSLRLALKKIAEITCGMRPKVIPVRVQGDLFHRTFTASIPFEYREEVLSYLAEHLSIEAPKEGKPLLLTSHEAAAVVELALKWAQCRSAA